jgi:hypothetical protein
MEISVMHSAQRHDELIADPVTPARLPKTQVMSI